MSLFANLLNQQPVTSTTTTGISSDFTTDMRLDARANKLSLSAEKTAEFNIGVNGMEELNALEDATANQEFISDLLEAAREKGIDAKAVVVVMNNDVPGNKPKYFSNTRLKVEEGKGVTSTIDTDNNFNLYSQLSYFAKETDGTTPQVIDFNLVKAFTHEELAEKATAIAEQNSLDVDTVLNQISKRYNLPYFYTKRSKKEGEESSTAYILRTIELLSVYFVTDVTVVL